MQTKKLYSVFYLCANPVDHAVCDNRHEKSKRFLSHSIYGGAKVPGTVSENLSRPV
jgi:hypothetical protein